MDTESYFRQLSHADFEQVMNICMKLHCTKPEKSFVSHSHAILNQASSNFRFSVEVYQLKPFRLREQIIQTPDYDYWIPLFKERVLDQPDIQRAIIVANSDGGMMDLEPGAKDFRYSALCNEFHERIQAPCQLWIGIRDGNELLNCIYSREKKCTDEQFAMMCLIQSNLEMAWKSWKRSHALKQELNLFKSSILQSEEKKAVAIQLRRKIETLTPRQRDVVELVASGKDNQQIADALRISVLTVKKHLQPIFQALNVQHRTELAAIWHQAYSIHLP